jgi:glutaredoxin
MKLKNINIGTGKGLLAILGVVGVVVAVSLALLPVSPLPVDSSVEGLSASNGVVIFTAPDCGYCDAAKAFFKRHEIAFGEYDVSTSVKVRQVFNRLGGRGVPLIIIGKTQFTGFNQATLSAFLRKKGML